MKLKMATLLTCLTVLLAPSTGRAWDTLDDVKDLFKQPGVRLVAVEFWSPACKPCNKAVPRWRELHEDYWSRGFRLVVVAIDLDGNCHRPKWRPDKVVCDDDHVIEKSWGIDYLPQGFLWTWQGNRLVERGTVEDVALAVEHYFVVAPRILVDMPAGPAGQELEDSVYLRDLIRSELRRIAKFELVATAEEREAIEEMRQDGKGLRWDDKARCDVGKEVPPNSVLLTRYEPGKSIVMRLVHGETGCLLALGKGKLADLEVESLERAATAAVA